MKKLITVILILALLLPAAASAASADDPDPIIGNWYFLYDKSAYPELASTFGDVDIALSVYWFTDSGTIMSTELTATGTDGNTSFTPTGRWSKSGDKYNYSIVGIGEGVALLEGETVLLSLPSNEGYYMIMRHMIPFNPYKDYAKR